MKKERKNMAKSFEDFNTTLEFQFENHDAALHFKAWLSNQGEQDYWESMRIREEIEKGNITGLSFDYHNGDVIKVKCGRLDEED